MDDTETAALLASKAWSTIVPQPKPEPLPRMTNPIWTVDGPDGRCFVLKRLPEFPPGVGPVDEFRVLCYLQGHGVPIALPVVTDDGHIHASVGLERYALLPYLESSGENHETGPTAASTAQAIGRAIGHLDTVLNGCPWQVPSFVDDPGAEILGRDLTSLPTEDVRPVLPLVERLRAAVTDLPIQRTHGDCNTGNVLVDHGEVTGFIDLDHLPMSPRGRDLSYYLASRVRHHLATPDSAQRDLDAMVVVLGDYVSGHQQTHPLTEHERAAIVPLMLISQIASAAWSLHGWTPDAEQHRQAVEAIAWIVEHLDRLTTAAGTPAMPGR
jgi:Ser/Thr protein kinase RdoA (MazF antagonist)